VLTDAVPWTPTGMVDALAADGVAMLREDDPDLYGVLEAECRRQARTLVMVASSSVVDPSVLSCQSSPLVNVTAEGYPGRRYHAGCDHVDEVESLAIQRAQSLFGAAYANVQPHSASVANELVLSAVLQPGDRLLGMDLRQGGHLTHGSPASVSGQYFDAHGYGVSPDGLIDLDEVRRLARQLRPRLIICGATAYPRRIDFAAFRAIADEVDAVLMADISHIAGLVAVGLHPSPIDHAHITTTCTHKQLFGPRGALVMSGRDAHSTLPGHRDTVAATLQRSVFPFFQGAPAVNVIAAKARALHRCASPEFAALARSILADARALAAAFVERGYEIVGRGTDNHMVLLDLRSRGISGAVAERALESCGIIVNKNHVPRDTRPATVTSGLRLGTNTLAARGAGPADMTRCVALIDRVLTALKPRGDRDFALEPAVRAGVDAQVRDLCGRWPMPRYPSTSDGVRDWRPRAAARSVT
jgi:glycine hydroxymethyltransferase